MGPRQLNRDPSKQSMHNRRLSRAARVNKPGERLLGRILRVFHEAQPDTPMLVVSMPLCKSRWLGDSWPNLQGFVDQIRSVVDEDFPDDTLITVVDAAQAVDESLFLTRNHLDPEGHIAFAEFLLPHIQTAMDIPGG